MTHRVIARSSFCSLRCTECQEFRLSMYACTLAARLCYCCNCSYTHKLRFILVASLSHRNSSAICHFLISKQKWMHTLQFGYENFENKSFTSTGVKIVVASGRTAYCQLIENAYNYFCNSCNGLVNAITISEPLNTVERCATSASQTVHNMQCL